MKLDSNLVINNTTSSFESSLNGTNVKGSYNTMQFAIRLRDDIRKALNSNEESYERTQAFSTYLHETIHWWQHVGSNFGFLYSLTYPAITTLSIADLKILIEKNIIIKPLLKYDAEYYAKHNKADIPELNRILNNYFDIEYAKLFALDNKNIQTIVEDKRFFLSIGHCYNILWNASIHSLTLFDESYDFLPNLDNWTKEFQKLSDKKADGFGIDAKLGISKLGIKAIYEGQAIFNQIQYLAISLKGKLTFEDCEKAGMLYGIYNEAFEYFIQNTGISKPDNFINSTVGLFLLVCDLSINPTNGFPFDIYDFENFINKNDPGIRFSIICNIINRKPEEYLGSISQYTKKEYLLVSGKISNEFGILSPQEGTKLVKDWFKKPKIAEILAEESNHKFINENLPIRLFFSKYLKFQEDKDEYPNVFCWIGYHMTSKNQTVDLKVVENLFQKHKALFIDDYDKEIKAMIFDNVDERQTIDTFNKFYQYNLLYDLILKWIYEDGMFKFDYKWLSNKTDEELIPPIKKEFKEMFGISIDDIRIK